MLVYPSSIDLSSRTLRYLTGRLAVRRGEIGTRWRRLTAGRQALLALAHLRCGDTYAQLAAGFGIGIATAYRYIREAVDVLAALAPTLPEAMDNARTKAFMILDGTLLPIDRIAADTPYYSGKHKRHGHERPGPSSVRVTAAASSHRAAGYGTNAAPAPETSEKSPSATGASCVAGVEPVTRSVATLKELSRSARPRRYRRSW